MHAVSVDGVESAGGEVGLAKPDEGKGIEAGTDGESCRTQYQHEDDYAIKDARPGVAVARGERAQVFDGAFGDQGSDEKKDCRSNEVVELHPTPRG